jgi:hypothetical protein
MPKTPIWFGVRDEHDFIGETACDVKPVAKGRRKVALTHIVSAFGSDGATWTTTFTFDKETSIENSTITGPDGKLTRCRNTFVFSSDRMAVSSTNECDDGSWWKVRGTKPKPAH